MNLRHSLKALWENWRSDRGEASLTEGISPEAIALGDYLQTRIGPETTLPEAVEAFTEMCHISTSSEMDMKLLEGGVFSFGEAPHFHFHIARQLQFPQDEDEYTQIQLTALYEPLEEYGDRFSGHVWDIDLEDDFFEHLYSSEMYAFFKTMKPAGYEIDVSQT